MERIIVNNLSKEFKIAPKKNQTFLAKIISLFLGREQKRNLKVLDNLTFNVKAGEILGIIGSNGCGKTTLLRIISDIYPLYGGSVKTNGKIVPVIGLGVGMSGRSTLRENIFLIGAYFGLSQREIKRKYNSIISFAELENFTEALLYQYSNGMIQKLAFSIVIHTEPDILLLDEVFAVGDEHFREKSAKKIKEFVKNGASVVFTSHELGLIEKFCDRVIWIDKGRIVKEGKPKEVIKAYKKVG